MTTSADAASPRTVVCGAGGAESSQSPCERLSLSIESAPLCQVREWLGAGATLCRRGGRPQMSGLRFVVGVAHLAELAAEIAARRRLGVESRRIRLDLAAKRLRAVLRVIAEMVGAAIVDRLHRVVRGAEGDGVADEGRRQRGFDEAHAVGEGEIGPQHPPVDGLGEGREDAQARRLDAELVPIEPAQAFHEGLADAVEAVRPNRRIDRYLRADLMEADRMDG